MTQTDDNARTQPTPTKAAPVTDQSVYVGPRFAQIPYALIGSGVSPRALQVWAAISAHSSWRTREAHPSHTAIGKALGGVSDDTITRAVRELELGGWIGVERRTIHRHGRLLTYNRYDLSPAFQREVMAAQDLPDDLGEEWENAGDAAPADLRVCNDGIEKPLQTQARSFAGADPSDPQICSDQTRKTAGQNEREKLNERKAPPLESPPTDELVLDGTIDPDPSEPDLDADVNRIATAAAAGYLAAIGERWVPGKRWLLSVRWLLREGVTVDTFLFLAEHAWRDGWVAGRFIDQKTLRGDGEIYKLRAQAQATYERFLDRNPQIQAAQEADALRAWAAAEREAS